MLWRSFFFEVILCVFQEKDAKPERIFSSICRRRTAQNLSRTISPKAPDRTAEMRCVFDSRWTNSVVILFKAQQFYYVHLKCNGANRQTLFFLLTSPVKSAKVSSSKQEERKMFRHFFAAAYYYYYFFKKSNNGLCCN